MHSYPTIMIALNICLELKQIQNHHKMFLIVFNNEITIEVVFGMSNKKILSLTLVSHSPTVPMLQRARPWLSVTEALSFAVK